MQAAIATETQKVTLEETQRITSGSTFFHGIVVKNSTVTDYEVSFTDNDGTEILSIAVPANKSFKYPVSFFADNGLIIIGLEDSGVAVTLAYTDDTVPVSAQAYIDTKAMDFATNETLWKSSDVPLGIGDVWSIQINTKPGSDSIDMYLMSLKEIAGNNNRLDIHLRGATANDPVRVLLYNSAGTLFKNYEFASTYTSGTKVSYIVTWNGTNLLFYVDGTLTAPTATATDNAGTMTATDRRTAIGSSSNFTHYTGTIHSISIWNSVLTQAEVTALQNSSSPQNFDNRYDSGNYASADSLQHYWRHGADASDIGRDFGNASTLIDIGDDAVNISAADIVNY